MTIQKKVGEHPINSRIRVTYPEKGEPTIDFEYPDNKRQIKDLWSSSGIVIIAFILTIITIIIALFLIYIFPPLNYADCTFKPYGESYSIVEGNYTSFENHLLVTKKEDLTLVKNVSSVRVDCGDAGLWTMVWEKVPPRFTGSWSVNKLDANIWREGRDIILPFIFLVLLYFGGIYGYGKLISLFMQKTNFGRKKYPLWNKIIHNKHFTAEFTKCPDNLQIEIPLFSNIYMDYEAEEEFADYLQEVEIKEHDIKYRKTKTFFGLLGRKKSILVPNVYLWKATFKFKKLPVKGKLVVSWT